MLTKKTLVVHVGGAGIKKVMIEPGVSVAARLRELKLPRYVLTKQNSNEPLAGGQALYPITRDGEELEATRLARVGSIGPTWFFLWLSFFVCAWILKRSRRKRWAWRDLIRKTYKHEASTVRTIPRGRIICVDDSSGPEESGRQADGVIRVKPDRRPIWRRKGWRKTRDEYNGFYETGRGRWPGNEKQKKGKDILL